MEYVILGNVPLTYKEYRMLRMLADGCNNCDIATAMGTTEHVTKNYMRPIYDKTGMANRLELALWFVRNNGYKKRLRLAKPNAKGEISF